MKTLHKMQKKMARKTFLDGISWAEWDAQSLES